MMLVLAAAAARGQQSPVNALAWLAGCWHAETGSGLVDEMWMAPAGGTMLGMSRTARADAVTSHEFLRIFARGDTLVYAATPSGQAPAEFTTRLGARDTLVFANPAHDFPQRVIYRRIGDSRVEARIEGSIGGRMRSRSFDYQRVRCER